MTKLIKELIGKYNITHQIEEKYQKTFQREARFLGNSIYTIAGLYSADTRELFIMFVAQQEFGATFD